MILGNEKVVIYLILELLAEKITPVHVVIIVITGITYVACVHHNIWQELKVKEKGGNSYDKSHFLILSYFSICFLSGAKSEIII